MNRTEAFELIIDSLKKAANIDGSAFSENTDLLKEKIIDSLDSMTLLFEIENTLGVKLDIEEDFEDFQISTLIDLITKIVAE